MKKLILASVVVFNIQYITSQTYTWADNTACIFYTNCTKCHFPGGIGPFSLVDYANAFAARFAIKQAVLDDKMPPWPPDPNYRSLAHEKLLTQAEKDVIIGWVDQGGMMGNAANAPTPPTYNPGTELGVIDYTNSIGVYTNPAVLDDYRCFVLPGIFAADQYISDIEILPGNRAMVHHVVIYADTSAQVLALDAADPGPGYTSFGGSGSSTSKMIGVWAPGTGVKSFPPGMGVKIMAGSRLVLQMHYPQGTDGETDSTRINFTYASGTVREMLIEVVLNHGDLSQMSEPLVIPPNTVKNFTQTFVIPDSPPSLDSSTLFSIFPHMHKVGRSMKVYTIPAATTDTVPLIYIPDWDFEWQMMYDFRQPIVVKEFDTFGAYAVYDNTSANPDSINYNDTVFAGEATDEEMMVSLFYYAPYLPGDENMIIDTSTVKPMYMGCSFVGMEDIANLYTQIRVYPSPADEMVTISFEQYEPGDLKFSLMDISGKILSEFIHPQAGTGTITKTIDIHTLPPGIYYLRVWNGTSLFAKPIVVAR